MFLLLQVSHRAVSNWLNILEAFYYCFRIYPFVGKNYRSLKKEPKFALFQSGTLSRPAHGRTSQAQRKLLAGLQLDDPLPSPEYAWPFELQEKEDIIFCTCPDPQFGHETVLVS